jgi:hypothetical protein
MVPKLMIQAMRSPGEKWTEYSPTSSAERIVIFREPELLLLEKPYMEVIRMGLHLRRLFGLVWEEVFHHSPSERLRQQDHCASSEAESYLWHCLLPAEQLHSGPRKQLRRDGYIGAARFPSRNRMLERWQRVN